ncbi:hypothetical protein CKO28_18790 [Rhodovibrio sodomensis]|uniref:Uncharacterized protein n=1 Tax=Rhodovibrio sodomensis TaxID=1088 RepID=A0ABS1DJC0_9PROT|nr:hypothetical protein [Rhodovibrio sodomensis]MBK1670086.1 hypothetical protein [Rhodovibrio sodomensis]
MPENTILSENGVIVHDVSYDPNAICIDLCELDECGARGVARVPILIDAWTPEAGRRRGSFYATMLCDWMAADIEDLKEHRYEREVLFEVDSMACDDPAPGHESVDVACSARRHLECLEGGLREALEEAAEDAMAEMVKIEAREAA